MDQPAKKRAGGQYDGARDKSGTSIGEYSEHPSVGDLKVLDRGLPYLHIPGFGQSGLHVFLVELAIRLSARPSDGRPLTAIQ